MARLFTAMAVGGQKSGLKNILNYLGSVMSRLFVSGTKQPRLERGRSLIGTDGLGWLGVSPPVQMNADLSATARALFLYLALSTKPIPPPM